MKCIYCGSEEMSYDNTTGMWYCESCQRTYDEDEIERETNLSVPTLFMLAFLCLIPIVNLFVLFNVVNSIIDDKYRNTLISVVLVQYFSLILVVMYLAVWQHSQAKQKAIEVFDKVQSYVSGLTMKDVDERYKVSYRTDYSEFLPKNYKADESEIDTLKKDLYLFSGTKMTGSKVLELTKAYDGTSTVFLIQTLNIKNRYGKDIYRNYNLRLSGTEDSSEELIKYFDIKDEMSVYITDYNEFEYLPTEDITKKKYIFYVNPKSEYEFTYDTIEDYGVFIFKELED